MIRTRAAAKELVAGLERNAPGTFALARVLALAARVEPELLRAARLRLFPQLTAGDEADLWFGPCVESSSTLWALFVPAIAEELRSELARRWPGDAQRARDLIVEMHVQAAPLVKLEETVHWLSLKGTARRAQVESALLPVLQAVRERNDEGVAQWAAHAIPRFSSWVRDLPVAWAIRVVAEQRLGGSVVIDPQAEALPDEAAAMLRDLLPTMEIWVRLTGGALEVSRQRLLGGHAIAVAATNPISVTVTDSKGSRSVRLQKAFERFAVEGNVEIRSLTGVAWKLSPLESTPRSHVDVRFFGGTELSPKVHKELGPLHLVFLSETIGEHLGEPSFHRLHEFSYLGDLAAPMVILVSRPLRDERGWAELSSDQRRAFGSHPFVPGKRPGDFAVTLEVDGALVGIIGLNTSGVLDLEQFVQVCGGSPEQWVASHHAAILVLPDLRDLRKKSGAMLQEIARWGVAFLVDQSDRGVSFLEPPVIVASIPIGTPILGTLRIGTAQQLEIQRGASKVFSGRVPIRLHPPPVDVPDPEHWILVAGSSYNVDPFVEGTARSIGHELVRNGFGLMTGGWDGVDEIVTLAYADALKARGVRNASRFIRHILGTIEPRPEIPGERLLYKEDNSAGAESVHRADAVILIGGRRSAAWIGNEAIRQKKVLIPIPQTRGAAQTFPLPRDARLRRAHEPDEIARAAVAVVSRRILNQDADPEPARARPPKKPRAPGPKSRKTVTSRKRAIAIGLSEARRGSSPRRTKAASRFAPAVKHAKSAKRAGIRSSSRRRKLK